MKTIRVRVLPEPGEDIVLEEIDAEGRATGKFARARALRNTSLKTMAYQAAMVCRCGHARLLHGPSESGLALTACTLCACFAYGAA
jgi:hypothetical protein